MSLKNFHLFFIMISIVAAAGFGLWCFLTEAGRRTTGSTLMGTLSFVLAAGLVIYAFRFIRKMERDRIE